MDRCEEITHRRLNRRVPLPDRKRPAFRPRRDAGRSLMFLRDFSDKQQHRAYGREHAADDADDGVDLSGFRVLLFLYEVADPRAEDERPMMRPMILTIMFFSPVQ